MKSEAQRSKFALLEITCGGSQKTPKQVILGVSKLVGINYILDNINA